MREQRHPEDTMRWIRRGGVLAALIIGWIFILIANHFHITPPVVFACLGYFAAVSAIYTLYRTGSTAVTRNDEDDDANSWGKPIGALDELEREKRTLLKAIKEAEFDLQMGKLSKSDAEAMIGLYRNRAIEVIKEIDVQNSTSGKAGSIRDRILREARARIHIEEKQQEAAAAAPKKKEKKDKGADKQKARADKLADAVNAAKADKADKASDDTKAAETSAADTSAADTSAADKSADDKSTADDKSADKVVEPADKPATDVVEAKAEKSAEVIEAAAEKPAVIEAAAEKPAVVEPAAEKPAVVETNADQPAPAVVETKAEQPVEAKPKKTDLPVEAKTDSRSESKSDAKSDSKSESKSESKEAVR